METLSYKRVLITGADGFIGSHLTELLVENGYEVRALAQYNSFNNWGWLENIRCKDGKICPHSDFDLSDLIFLKRSISGISCHSN